MSQLFLEDPLTLVTGRRATFKKWPYMRPADKCIPQALSEAGFYHRPDISEDSVQCFVCRNLLCSWAPDEDPMTQHKMHFPDCPFVLLVEAHGGGYEVASRRAVIEVECARFRAKFIGLFEEEAQKRREICESDLRKVEKAALVFTRAVDPPLPKVVSKSKISKRRHVR